MEELSFINAALQEVVEPGAFSLRVGSKTVAFNVNDIKQTFKPSNMKHIFTLAFLACMLGSYAQVGIVTWEVNMANEEVSPDGVYLAGGDYLEFLETIQWQTMTATASGPSPWRCPWVFWSLHLYEWSLHGLVVQRKCRWTGLCLWPME